MDRPDPSDPSVSDTLIKNIDREPEIMKGMVYLPWPLNNHRS